MAAASCASPSAAGGAGYNCSSHGSRAHGGCAYSVGQQAAMSLCKGIGGFLGLRLAALDEQ